MIEFDTTGLRFDGAGLIPAIVQSAITRKVLMVAWMNQESLSLSLETGETVFFSRSRNELWHKGSTSGNVQRILSVSADCDKDTLLIQVEAAGPACHTGSDSCFEAHDAK
jgi:phosphoribosyl-ATP pyrophosphohydrolase/phosphoribosyl-AMP cyclohydrolase